MFYKEVEDIELNAYVDGKIKPVRLYDFKGKYIALVFYPADFTFVCPTELNKLSDRFEEFIKKDIVVPFVSKDTEYSHKAWAETERSKGGVKGVRWPMLSDLKGKLSKRFGLYDKNKGMITRSTVLIDKDMKMFHLSINHDLVGRSTHEILRLVDAMDFAITNGNICPCDWTI